MWRDFFLYCEPARHWEPFSQALQPRRERRTGEAPPSQDKPDRPFSLGVDSFLTRIYILTRLSKALGVGLGFCLGGPAWAVLGYFIGKAVGPRISRLSDDSSLAHYYETLKVSPVARTEEIKRSYRMLVKEYHPDLQGQVDEETGNLLKKKMATLNEAYGEIRRVRSF